MDTQIKQPKLYISEPHPCAYLMSETSSTLLIDPSYPLNQTQYSILLRSGFRRNGNTVYRPHCRNCNACVSVKIPVTEYRPNRSQKRCAKRNQDIYTTMVPAKFSEEHFDLYCRYQAYRHPADVMDHNDVQLYQNFMVESCVETVFIEHRLNTKLLTVSVCDFTDDGLSAVYTFFDPQMRQRSLGTFAIIHQIEYVQRLGLDWLYLGYWLERCKKMAYKKNFYPLFGYIGKEWRLIGA